MFRDSLVWQIRLRFLVFLGILFIVGFLFPASPKNLFSKTKIKDFQVLNEESERCVYSFRGKGRKFKVVEQVDQATGKLKNEVYTKDYRGNYEYQHTVYTTGRIE